MLTGGPEASTAAGVIGISLVGVLRWEDEFCPDEELDELEELCWSVACAQERAGTNTVPMVKARNSNRHTGRILEDMGDNCMKTASLFHNEKGLRWVQMPCS
jgi:hypothetical protein